MPQDLRKAQPYLGYETYDFDIPVGTTGDVFDRYLVRTEEMRQSLRIIRQVLDRLEPGPVMVDDPKIALPSKEKVYTRMESLIHHFKLIMHGMEMPVGEVYSATEAANGERRRQEPLPHPRPSPLPPHLQQLRRPGEGGAHR